MEITGVRSYGVDLFEGHRKRGMYESSIFCNCQVLSQTSHAKVLNYNLPVDEIARSIYVHVKAR